MSIQSDALQSIRKKYHRLIWSKFTKAIVEFELVKPNDKIAVCISGGKDSMLMAMLFQELKRHNKFDFELVFLVMDPGYNQINRDTIENNARLLDVPITIFETSIFGAVEKIENNPCYLCARMRRGNLYSKAKELGCNKIALGHHFDDVIETILMSMIYGGQIETMLPKLHSSHFELMELIRPLYYIRENDIISWCADNDLHFIRCACRFTENSEEKENLSKRKQIKALIKTLHSDNGQIDSNIFRSVQNINLNKIMSYKDKNGVHSFLDDYDN